MKRASGNLDAENDEEDESTFNLDKEDELKKRRIKTAVRKLPQSSTHSSALPFAGFQGFQVTNTTKDKEKPFAFLSKIYTTNAGPIYNYSGNGDNSCAKSDNNSVKTDSVKSPDAIDETEQPSTINIENLSAEDLYFHKLKTLNYNFTDWVLKHINENLNYVLTPIFVDYEKHLKTIREERRQSTLLEESKLRDLQAQILKEQNVRVNYSTASETVSKCDNDKIEDREDNLLNVPNTFEKDKESAFDAFPGSDTTINAEETDTKQSNSALSFAGKSDWFAGPSTLAKPSNETDKNGNGLLDDNVVEIKESSSVDEIATQSNIVSEAGSVYSKRCKVFIKIDRHYRNHGIGIMHVKLIGEEKRCQVIVRSHDTPENIIIDCIITKDIPMQKIGKNNAMLTCSPTPGMPPTSVMLKVKTSEEAFELIDVLNKFRK